MIARVLVNRFIFAPAKLSWVVGNFDGLDHRCRFIRLVEEFLPEHRESMVAMEHPTVVDRFVALFSKKYFPIYRPAYSDLKVFLNRIHTETLGLERHRYDSAWNMQPGHLIAGVLCECPYEDADNLAIVARFGDLLVQKGCQDPKAVTGKLLPGGIPLEDIERCAEESGLEDLFFPGLLEWCRWLHHRTGNRWWDTEPGAVGWDRETVEALAADRPGYEQIRKRMETFNAWLGHGFPARAQEVIDYFYKHLNEVTS